MSVALTEDKKTARRRGAPSPVSDPLPDFVAPALATLLDRPPAGEDFLSELKFDGYRALARVDLRDRKTQRPVTLYTRNGNDWTTKFAPIAKDLAKLQVNSAYLDGEIVVLNASGHSDFQALQNSFDELSCAPLYYFVFDLLYLNGHDIRHLPLIQRKALLKSLLTNSALDRVRYSEHHTGDAEQFLREACAHKIEGIVCKNARAPYVSGRGTSWVKIKCTSRQEFIIVGYSAPKGTRQHIGALLLGAHDPDGSLRYVGRVGTGFTHESLMDLREKLGRIETDSPPVKSPPRARDITWVKPTLVCEIQFGHLTRDKLLRQAVFFGLRADKKPEEVHMEAPMHVRKRGKKGKG